jgi:hypothetical protein
MAIGSKHSAPGQAAGYMFQIERALRHLAFSGTGALVGIETLDDVVVSETDGRVVFEQDKHTISGANPISDRSKGLWKSLNIWTEGIASGDIDLDQAQFLLVTNQIVSEGLAFSLKTESKLRDDSWEQELAKELRRIGKDPATDIKEFVTLVLSKSDQDLIALVKKVTVVDGSSGGNSSHLAAELTGKLLLDAQHASDIFHGLVGWLHDVVMDSWRSGREAVVNRERFGKQLRFLQHKFQSQQLFRETSEALVPVKDEDRNAHRDDLFVRQLLWVGIEEGDNQLLDALDDFLKCATERTRLAQEGNIPILEFRAFDDRLVKRWKMIAGPKVSSVGAILDSELAALGREILGSVLNHRESLAGQQTQEFYLTTGAYHRLANDPKEKPRVGWHPKYQEMCRLSEILR